MKRNEIRRAGTDWTSFFLLVNLIFLPACSLQTSSETPTPQLVRIQYTPAARSLSTIIQACAWENQHINLLAEELPAQALDLQSADLVIRLGEPRPMPAFSAPVGWDDLVLVVHPANPLTTIDTGQVRQIFTGNVQQWTDLTGQEETIQVWDYPMGNEIQGIFHSALSEGNTRYSLAHLAPNPAAMLEAIGGDPAAIGYIPKSWLSPAVKEVTIEGQIKELLHQPVLVLAGEEPSGAARDFLACLQSYF
jgi:hypothetical protein